MFKSTKKELIKLYEECIKNRAYCFKEIKGLNITIRAHVMDFDNKMGVFVIFDNEGNIWKFYSISINSDIEHDGEYEIYPMG